MTPQDGDREATQDDRECAIQVMRAVRDLDAATRNLDIVEGLRLAHAAGDLIAAHVAAATAKERQARELAEGELALTRTLLDSERVAKIERGDMYMDALEAGEKNAKRLHWLHDCSTGTTDP